MYLSVSLQALIHMLEELAGFSNKDTCVIKNNTVTEQTF